MTSADEANDRLEDLSGIVLQPGENPYLALIRACHDNATEIQTLYAVHRTKRNAQQKAKFLAAAAAGHGGGGGWQGLVIDQTILRLERPLTEPGFRDERNCLVFWARPPDHVVRLAAKLQALLRATAPGLWLMPTHKMHMTALEVAFSKTPSEIAALVERLRPAMPDITSYTYRHRTRLVKPMVSHDTSAVAVSFLPAAGEAKLSPDPADGVAQHDDFTYHHLRRDLFDKVRDAGLQVESRYQVPSAHITLGRFLDEADHDTPDKRRRWVSAIDEINAWLEREVWDAEDGPFVGEWLVGQERGLDARAGTLWYGGGRTVLLGEGF